MGNPEKIGAIADKLIAAKKAGEDVVAVVSAIGGETDKLLNLAAAVTDSPSARELDVLLSTGEQVSIALLCMALQARGCSAKSYTGWQVRMLTDNAHSKARIQHIDADKIQRDLADGHIVVVAGFQGCDEQGNITTLGRGGSDTTAVAIAAALKADECQIFTDVDGVYTTDPRIVEGARRLEQITFEEMLELASLGAKVLQIRSVEFAGKYQVPLRVLSTFDDGPGTLISLEDNVMEQPVISGIAFNRDEAKLTITGVPDMPGVASQILGPVAEANIEVDMIIQNIAADGCTDFTFTVHRRDFETAETILRSMADTLGAREVIGDDSIAKVSVVGVGMRSHAGVAAKLFSVLSQENINIMMISTSEIKISVVIQEKYMELAVRSLHKAFELEKEAGDKV